MPESTQSHTATLQEVIEENKRLKEKLTSTEEKLEYLENLCHDIFQQLKKCSSKKVKFSVYVLDKKIRSFELTERSSNCLTNSGIKYVGELVQLSEQSLKEIKGLGPKSFKEILEILKSRGLKLNMDLGGWKPPIEE